MQNAVMDHIINEISENSEISDDSCSKNDSQIEK